MKKKAIVFAPHPDDETLGCGGSIAKKLNEGYDVYVVFVTDGRHSLTQLGVSSGPTPVELKEIRKEEALKATRILGLQEKNLLFFDFEEQTLGKHEKLVQKRITEVLEDIYPSEIFFPQEKEYNTDHRITNKIVRTAVDISNLRPIEYQYTIAWSFPFYLLWHIMNERAFDLFSLKFVHRDSINLDISKFLPLKEMAVKEYKSQTTVIANDQKTPVLKHSFIKRFLKKEEKFFINSSIA
jgi:LmbE family N-acetylglucosaminyl deacetylase